MNVFFYMQKVSMPCALCFGCSPAALSLLLRPPLTSPCMCCTVDRYGARILAWPCMTLLHDLAWPSPITLPPSLPQRGGGRVLATPRLSGTILPGITRDSILHLARAWGGCDVEERPVTIEEVRQVCGQPFWFGGQAGGMLVHRGTCCCPMCQLQLVECVIEQLQCAHTAFPHALNCSGQPGGPAAGDRCLPSVPFCCCLSESWAFLSPAGQPGGPAAGGVRLGHSLHRAAHRRTGQVRTQRSYMHRCAVFGAWRLLVPMICSSGACLACSCNSAPQPALPRLAACSPPGVLCSALTSLLWCRHLPLRRHAQSALANNLTAAVQASPFDPQVQWRGVPPPPGH